MGKELFHNLDIYPTKELLHEELGDAFVAYEAFLTRFEKEYPSINLSFRYYNDTKSWLGKAEKKKTVFWLSFWPGYFKFSFFFNRNNIERLSSETRKLILEEHLIKKNPPIILNIDNIDQIDTLFKVIEEKRKSL